MSPGHELQQTTSPGHELQQTMSPRHELQQKATILELNLASLEAVSQKLEYVLVAAKTKIGRDAFLSCYVFMDLVEQCRFCSVNL